MKASAIFSLAALLITLMLPGPALAEKAGVRLGVSLPTTNQERWVRDGEAMRAAAASENIEIFVETGNNNQMQQNLQVGKLLSQQIDVLILAPHDAVGAASMVRRAHDRGVKVISYDRLVLNPEVDVYLTFDNEKVGELQARYLVQKAPRGDYLLLTGSPNDNNSRYLKAGAMKVLEPLVRAGAINIVADRPVIDWDPANARRIAEELLAQGVRPAAVVAPNDSSAGGVIEALERYGLAGKIPIGGQDGDLMAARRIAAGTQSMTVFKDTRLLAAKAVELAAKMAGDEDWRAEVNYQSPAGGGQVPTILLEPVAVEKSTLEKILINSGYLDRDEVFERF